MGFYLRMVRVADLAYMNFDPYTYFGAQLKRLGNAGNNQDRGLSLLGGEDRIPDVLEDQDQPIEVPTQGLDTVVVDQADECTDTDTDPIGGATVDYDISLGARPKRVINKPKRFNDFQAFTGKLEPLFMAADMIQRSAIQAALKLHLSICDQNCCDHKMYEYLLEQGHALEPCFGEITNQVRSVKIKGKINKRVHFVDTIQLEDGSLEKLNNYKIALENPKQVLLYGCNFVECSSKELLYVQLVYVD